MKRLAWSVASATAQPDLRLQLRVIIELLGLLPRASAGTRLTVLPSNLLVGTDGSVLIGAARGDDDGAEQRYLAPEVRAGADPGIPAAVYAVGALLFEAVTGYSFESFEVVQRELSGSRAMVKAAGLGGSFWEIYLLEAAAKATAEVAEERWATPADFARDLERMASDRVASRAELGEFIAKVAVEARRPSSAPPAPGRSSNTAPPQRSPAWASAQSPARPVFDSEPRTLEHQTKLGAGPGRPMFDSEPTTLKKQTLVGIGLDVEKLVASGPLGRARERPNSGARAPESESAQVDVSRVDVAAASAPVAARARGQDAPAPGGDPRPVRDPVPHGTLLGLGQLPVAALEAAPRPNRTSSPAFESAPPVHTESDEPSDTASAVTAYPVKKSRAGRWMLALMAVGGLAAGSLEYTGGHVTRAVHQVLPAERANNAPSLRSTKGDSASRAVAHEDAARGSRASAPEGSDAVPAHVPDGSESQIAAAERSTLPNPASDDVPCDGCDADARDEPEAVNEATPEAARPAADLDDDATEPAKTPPRTRPRAPGPKPSPPKEPDYGI